MGDTTTRPQILQGFKLAFEGVDSRTPPGYTLAVARVVGIWTIYLVKDGSIVGRVEIRRGWRYLYAGSGTKGGQFRGVADDDTTGLAQLANHLEPAPEDGAR